jgi:DNA polymerase I-like protein with 3'-5' exonuclease and polymerase domains
MGIKQITHRKTGRPTTDETTLQRIAKRDPLLAPICEFVNDIRSLGTYRAVCSVPMDHDNRLRCSYVIPGTDTFRFASKEDAFGFGTNLQNITSGTSVSPDELDELIKKGFLIKPNLRKLFIPDLGFMLGEFDLPQADAQVVAWEAEDDILKAIFKDPERDLHSENAVAIFGRDAYIPGTSGIPSKKTIKPTARQYAKVGFHAADYGAQARTLATALGISTTMAEAFLDAWFKAHPNIKDWQNTVSTQIQTRRYVENRFGYRRYCFSRFEDDYKECLAWIPQSTVAIITNTGIREVTKDLRVSRQVHFLLQVHDSAVFQFPIHNAAQIAGEIKRLMTVPVPYPDPLIMVPDAKFSEISWGDAKKSAI